MSCFECVTVKYFVIFRENFLLLLFLVFFPVFRVKTLDLAIYWGRKMRFLLCFIAWKMEYFDFDWIRSDENFPAGVCSEDKSQILPCTFGAGIPTPFQDLQAEKNVIFQQNDGLHT